MREACKKIFILGEVFTPQKLFGGSNNNYFFWGGAEVKIINLKSMGLAHIN